MKRKSARNEIKSKLSPDKLLLPCTFNEVRYYVSRYTGRKITDRGLHYWFTWCRISLKYEYDWTDICKLVVFGSYLNRVRSYEYAQSKLVEEILSDKSWFFPEEKNTSLTIEVRAIAA